MSETIVQTASLVGHVIADLTFEPLQPSQFRAELSAVAKAPQYKPGGFFVFPDLAPGTYTVRLVGQQFQTVEQSVTIPHPGLVLEAPGSNEVLVTVSSANGTRITFEAVLLPQPIRVGAAIRGPQGFSATLSAALDQGRVMEARIENSTGALTPGAIVRIIRDLSIRLPWNPYAPLPVARARLVGTVRRLPAPGYPLQGAQARLTQVNGVSLALQDVAGVNIATVALNGTPIIIGTERDILTSTNSNGDFHLYFSVGDGLENVTVEVTLDGYQSETITTAISSGQRQRIEVQLTAV